MLMVVRKVYKLEVGRSGGQIVENKSLIGMMLYFSSWVPGFNLITSRKELRQVPFC